MLKMTKYMLLDKLDKVYLPFSLTITTTLILIIYSYILRYTIDDPRTILDLFTIFFPIIVVVGTSILFIVETYKLGVALSSAKNNLYFILQNNRVKVYLAHYFIFFVNIIVIIGTIICCYFLFGALNAVISLNYMTTIVIEIIANTARAITENIDVDLFFGLTIIIGLITYTLLYSSLFIQSLQIIKNRTIISMVKFKYLLFIVIGPYIIIRVGGQFIMLALFIVLENATDTQVLVSQILVGIFQLLVIIYINVSGYFVFAKENK